MYVRPSLGVFYTGTRWAIFVQDVSPMPLNALFHIHLPAGGFTHLATTANIHGNWTVLDHEGLNNNPDAVVLVTPNYTQSGNGGLYHPFHIGVFFIGGRWAIFNQDFSPMQEGAAFNVWAAPPPV